MRLVVDDVVTKIETVIVAKNDCITVTAIL